jgi:phage portal protein BeeE
MVSLLLRGNAYGKILTRDRLGYPTSIMLINPDQVQVRQDQKTFEVTYRLGQDPTWYTTDDVWHCKGLTMPGGFVGLSPVAYAASTIGAVQGILALVLICVGVGMFSVPAAFIVAGALLLIDRVL